MDYIILAAIGLVTGLFGGMLGIGGSMIIIPAMSLIFGENQHLYQASAMICNFFVAVSSLIAHSRAKSLITGVLIWLIPTAILGILLGVALSNIDFFSGDSSYILARIFGAFLVYVAVFNCLKFKASQPNRQYVPVKNYRAFSIVIGAITGFFAGLLGIGAGGISTPLQQQLFKMPLRRAMSNSSALIAGIALIGAAYKNATLSKHDITFELFAGDSPLLTSLRIAALIIPTAMIGGFIGGHLMHKLPKNFVRAAFIIVVAAAALKMLTAK